MKLYVVECKRYYDELWDNWYGDYVEAAGELSALEDIKQWLIEQGVDTCDIMFRVKEV